MDALQKFHAIAAMRGMGCGPNCKRCSKGLQQTRTRISSSEVTAGRNQDQTRRLQGVPKSRAQVEVMFRIRARHRRSSRDGIRRRFACRIERQW